jgi:sec-independent protein translocase protein TatC
VTDDKRMPLRQHLDELRKTLLRCVFVFAALFAAGLFFLSPLLKFINVPWTQAREAIVAAGSGDPGPLVYIGASEGMIFGLKIAFLAAMLVGAPFYLWELWRFIGVGLVDVERGAVRKAFLPSVGMLLLGMYFGFSFILPFAFQFLVTYLPEELAIAQVTVTSYLGFVSSLTLLMGFVFETPLIMWVLVRAGLVKLETLKGGRRMSVLCVMIFAAIATPPDPFTMVFVALPMLVLYEVGLLLGRQAERARATSDAKRI